MTVLPHHRIQCDRCRTAIVLKANKSEYWGEELHGLGWVARPIRGVYQHACRQCAEEFIAGFEGRRVLERVRP